MDKFKDRVASVTEYLLSGLWILGAISSLTQPPLGDAGPVAQFFGNEVALVFWAIVFAALGLGLIYAKISKRKRLHQAALGWSYGVSVFVLLLEILIFGGGVESVDGLLFSFLSAVLWLRWRLKTAYINPDEFKDDVEELRDDLPPPPLDKP